MLTFVLALALSQQPTPEHWFSIRNSADKLWGECLVDKATQLAIASREPAETLALAAFAACSEWESAVQQANDRAMAGYPDLSANALAKRKDYWREHVVLAVIEARS